MKKAGLYAQYVVGIVIALLICSIGVAAALFGLGIVKAISTAILRFVGIH